MALTENLASENVTPTGIGAATQGVTKGLDAGLAYAAAKQKSDEMAQQIQQMKDQHEAQKTSYVLGQIDKASQVDNKSLRKLYMEGADQSFQKFYGVPMSNDIKNFITNIPESGAGVKKLMDMYPDFASDPKQHALFVANFKSMFNSNLSDAEGFANKISEDHAKLIAAKTRGDLGEARVEQGKERLKQGAERLGLAAVKNAQNSSPVQDSEAQIYGIDKALSAISKAKEQFKKNGETMTWGQVHEVTADTAQSMMAKMSAVMPMARQEGIEKDIPKVAQFLGTIQTNVVNSPSKNVPIGVLTSLESQLNSIRKIAAVYNKLQLGKRLDPAVQMGAVSNDVAQGVRNSAAGNTQPPSEQPAGNVTQGNDPASKIKSMNPGKKFSELFPSVQKALEAKGVTPQSYDAGVTQ